MSTLRILWELPQKHVHKKADEGKSIVNKKQKLKHCYQDWLQRSDSASIFVVFYREAAVGQPGPQAKALTLLSI